jgi:hypothetical protein
VRFRGVQLVLNVNTGALGEVQVEIQDENGSPIPGFSLAESDIIHSTNQVSRPVSWTGSTAVDKLAGKPVRLHFVLRNADIYAFQFWHRPSI